jgi:hypothetical protein
MTQKFRVNFYISKHSPKEVKKRSGLELDFYIVDITKIIREMGYETQNLSPESEFIINHSIRSKIAQGIYSTKCDSILVCYRNVTPDFVKNLEEFLDEFQESLEYTIHRI